MDNWTACEIAYKNGYEAGQKDAMIEFLTEYGATLKEIVANLDRLLEEYKAE